MSEPMKIDIWSDVACPWCYIGKRNLEAGIAELRVTGEAPPIEIEFHSFELDPNAPIEFRGSHLEYLTRIKGYSQMQATRMIERVAVVAAGAGLDFDLDAVKHTRTVKAHQLLHHARAHGRQPELKERLMSAYFVEGRHLGRLDELASLAADVGLDADEARRVLKADEYLDAVRADQAQAAAYGIEGVPFFVVDGRYGLSGAQPPHAFAAALRQIAAGKVVAGSED